MWVFKMHGNMDFHKNFQLWILCRNDDCSIAVLKMVVRNNMHYLSSINGNYDATQFHKSQMCICFALWILRWALSTLSINLQPFLCGLTQLSPLLLSGAHPKLQSGRRKNPRDVNTQDMQCINGLVLWVPPTCAGRQLCLQSWAAAGQPGMPAEQLSLPQTRADVATPSIGVPKNQVGQILVFWQVI